MTDTPVTSCAIAARELSSVVSALSGLEPSLPARPYPAGAGRTARSTCPRSGRASRRILRLDQQVCQPAHQLVRRQVRLDRAAAGSGDLHLVLEHAEVPPQFFEGGDLVVQFDPHALAGLAHL